MEETDKVAVTMPPARDVAVVQSLRNGVAAATAVVMYADCCCCNPDKGVISRQSLSLVPRNDAEQCPRRCPLFLRSSLALLTAHTSPLARSASQAIAASTMMFPVFAIAVYIHWLRRSLRPVGGQGAAG